MLLPPPPATSSVEYGDVIPASQVLSRGLPPSVPTVDGRLPKVLHYVWLRSFGYGSRQAHARAREWASNCGWDGCRVVFWTDAEIEALLRPDERAIFNYYGLPLQQLYYASYTVLHAVGGVFLHPNYVPHELFWIGLRDVWIDQQSDVALTQKTSQCGCRWWNGLIASVPRSAAMQHLRQLVPPRYLTPADTDADAEWTTGCQLLAQLVTHMGALDEPSNVHRTLAVLDGNRVHGMATHTPYNVKPPAVRRTLPFPLPTPLV